MRFPEFFDAAHSMSPCSAPLSGLRLALGTGTLGSVALCLRSAWA